MKKIATLFLFLFLVKGYSQSNPEKKTGVWYMYGGSHKIAENWKVKTLAHFRFFNIGSDLQQLLIRTGINYIINNKLGFLIGHAYFHTDLTFNTDRGRVNEHRIYEDFYIANKVDKLNLAHRLRAEQRFLNSEIDHFLRYQLTLKYPISKKWSTYLYDEVFLDFTGESFNQNWLGAGFKYKLSKQVNLQVGYQKISLNGGANFDRILTGISISTNHRKKNKF